MWEVLCCRYGWYSWCDHGWMHHCSLGQVRGAWRVATSTNPNSMNKAARREYQALTKFTILGWFWECCADVVLKRWPLWTCKFGGGCTLVVSSSTFSIFRLFAALPLVFSATLIFWEAFPVVSLPPPIALGVPSQLVQLFFFWFTGLSHPVWSPEPQFRHRALR